MQHSSSLSLKQQAELVLSLTDLTTLELDDTPEKVKGLCEKATTALDVNAAAVCVYPKLVPVAVEAVVGSSVSVATVVNFPSSTESLEATLELTNQALQAGAQEVDLVFPFKKFLNDIAQKGTWNEEGTELTNKHLLVNESYIYVETIAHAVHQAKAKLKVIIESGELTHPYFIKLASEISVKAGADFLKTSTGKVPVSATLSAAKVMLEVIKKLNPAVGFKASGGIRTVAQAMQYIDLAASILGKEYIFKPTFRFGASGIFNDIKSILETGEPLVGVSSQSY